MSVRKRVIFLAMALAPILTMTVLASVEQETVALFVKAAGPTSNGVRLVFADPDMIVMSDKGAFLGSTGRLGTQIVAFGSGLSVAARHAALRLKPLSAPFERNGFEMRLQRAGPGEFTNIYWAMVITPDRSDGTYRLQHVPLDTGMIYRAVIQSQGLMTNVRNIESGGPNVVESEPSRKFPRSGMKAGSSPSFLSIQSICWLASISVCALLFVWVMIRRKGKSPGENQ